MIQKGINVLSLFDGISCGQIALERARIKVNKYFASEIDSKAIAVTLKNYPNTELLGNVITVKAKDLPKIDLLIGGSPCQGFSFAGKQLNFNDSRSRLFFEYVRLLKECNPRYFLLENVKMKKEYEDVISKFMGVPPILINSALVSAQNRKRLYWSNIPYVKQPKNKHIYLKNIIEHGLVDRDKSYCIDANYFKGGNLRSYFEDHRRQLVFEKPHGYNKGGVSAKTKFGTLRSCTAYNYAIRDKLTWRKLTVTECERLQTVPNGYTSCVSKRVAYFLLGNCWTVDVVDHIFRGITKYEKLKRWIIS